MRLETLERSADIKPKRKKVWQNAIWKPIIAIIFFVYEDGHKGEWKVYEPHSVDSVV
jgi:hypothetical protein